MCHWTGRSARRDCHDAPPAVADHRNAPVNALGYLRVVFAVDDIDGNIFPRAQNRRLRNYRNLARHCGGSNLPCGPRRDGRETGFAFRSAYNSTYEEGRGWGYPEGPIYWFNAAYVLRLLFTEDGSLARLELKPEAFLHGQMSATGVKLGASDVQSFLKAAKQLRPLSDPVDVHKPPLCFQSGSGSYCSDRYAQAKVDQYLRGSLKSVTIAYKQSRHGTVSDRQAFPFNRIKVGQRWYAIDQKLYNDAVIGSTVNLTTFGCGVESIDCEAIGNKANPQK